MAANSFDYAFEDIDLIRQAVEALREVADTVVEHQKAIHDLQLLETVLCGVQRLSPADLRAETRRNIHYCSHFCRPPLGQFLQRLKQLKPDLDRVLKQNTPYADVDPALDGTAKLVKEVAILQKSIGNGLRVIKVLLWVEELGCNVTTNTFLPRELQQTIESLQGSLSSSNGRHYGRGHAYNDIHVSGSGRNHFGDNYYGDPTLVASLDGLSRRLDDMASACQVDRLLSLVENSKIMSSPRLEVPSVNTHPMIQSCNNQQSISSPLAQHVKSGIQSFLETLLTKLNALLVILLLTIPAFQTFARTMATFIRSPNMLLDSNITFVDALNRETSLQYQQFRYWPVVSAWLEFQFRDCPGALLIPKKRFAIFKDMSSSSRGIMIPFDQWERMVFPGHRVLMSMDIGHHVTTTSSPTGNFCPSCALPASRSTHVSFWTKCADCGQSFLRLDSQQDQQTKSTAVGQDTFHFYRPATPDDGFDCSDISAFSRVHDHLDQQPKLTKKGDLERAAPPGRCHSCNRAETPEWRRGPDGARTLCNACGLHYARLTCKQNNASKNAAPPGRCHSCNRAETPEWRRGPDGARTLCNACGLHYARLTRKQNNASKNAAVNNSNLRPKENM